MPDMMKPEAMRWRTALRCAASKEPMPALPPPGTVVLPPPEAPGRLLSAKLGFRPLGPQMLRVDLGKRLARHAHEARSGTQATDVDARTDARRVGQEWVSTWSSWWSPYPSKKKNNNKK